MYDLENVIFESSQTIFYRNKPAVVAFSADVYNVKEDQAAIPSGATNFALKVGT